MAKKMLLLGIILAFCVFSVSAQSRLGYDLYGTAIAWVVENLEGVEEYTYCTWSPDGMFYNGRYINWSAACQQHDQDYENGVNKNEADRKLRDAMIRLGAPRRVAELYYSAVQQFGQSRYDAAQRNYSLPSDSGW